jgi:hypothetical protein
VQRTSAPFAASEAVLDWCLRNAARCAAARSFEEAALWAHVGAGTAVAYGHRYLCVPQLEALLLHLAATLAVPAARATSGTRPRRWLHVFSITMGIGGHTALARRWIARNPQGDRHDVVLTMQARDDVAPALAEAVHRTGGEVTSLACVGALTERAAALREQAWRDADVVVLHAHMWDVIPALAFGVAGGPPVLLVDHADHAFWVGCAVADVVVDIRDSGLALSTSLRGARASAVLPVPLEDGGVPRPDRAGVAAKLRGMRVLDRGLVLLTIGSSSKYRAHARLDFVAAAERIVDEVDDSILIAIGPDPRDERWRAAAARTRGRMVAVGERADLPLWHAACDLYLESFPVGSYTALLEVGLAGRAFVRKPWLAPPHALPIDQGALAPFAPAPDPRTYVTQALALARDADARARCAEVARQSVAAVHCGAGWDAQLGALERAIEPRHTIGLRFAPQPMPAVLLDYVGGLHAGHEPDAPWQAAHEAAAGFGLEPRPDGALHVALQAEGTRAPQA